MRVIKFRAWVKSKSLMINDCFVDHWDVSDGDRLRFKRSDCDVMQYLGRNDKNGVAMYEGDRVKFVAIEDERKRHKSEAEGVIEWDDEDLSFYILNDNDKFPHVKFWFAENIEVIGNKYEGVKIKKNTIPLNYEFVTEQLGTPK